MTCKPTELMESDDALLPWYLERGGCGTPARSPGSVAGGPGEAPALHLCRKQETAAFCCTRVRCSPAQAQSLDRERRQGAGGRRAYFSVSDSWRTCCSSASSSRSRSSRSSSSLAESSMASCWSLSKRLVSPEVPEPRPSELLRRLSWMALR